MNNENGKIELACFIKKPTNEDIMSISEGIVNGSIKVFASKKDENGVKSDFERVYLDDDIFDMKLDIFDKIRVLNSNLKKAQEESNYVYMSKYKANILLLEEELKKIDEYQTYSISNSILKEEDGYNKTLKLISRI